MNEVKKVIVKVPATTANMGPGFDCFGCAFNMYNVLTFEVIDKGLSFEGFEEAYCNEDNLAVAGFRAVMLKMWEKFPQNAGTTKLGEMIRNGYMDGLKISIETNIPICRGLGSSSSLLAAAAIAANVLHDSPFSKQELLEITTELEGHPDNLAPCLLGGMTASMMVGGRPHTVHYFINPTIQFVALIPDFEFPTSMSRAALPKALVYQDAVYNIAHGGILLKALENGDEELISLALDDRLHEPYRRLLIKGSDIAEEAARKAGAMAFCLSGAGPTFMCLTKDPEFEDRIRGIMEKMLPTWQVQPLTVDYVGATYKKVRENE